MFWLMFFGSLGIEAVHDGSQWCFREKVGSQPLEATQKQRMRQNMAAKATPSIRPSPGCPQLGVIAPIMLAREKKPWPGTLPKPGRGMEPGIGMENMVGSTFRIPSHRD